MSDDSNTGKRDSVSMRSLSSLEHVYKERATDNETAVPSKRAMAVINCILPLAHHYRLEVGGSSLTRPKGGGWSFPLPQRRQQLLLP